MMWQAQQVFVYVLKGVNQVWRRRVSVPKMKLNLQMTEVKEVKWVKGTKEVKLRKR